MSSAERLTGALASGGALVVGFLTGRWLADKLRANARRDSRRRC